MFEWSASRPCRFTGERALVSIWQEAECTPGMVMTLWRREKFCTAEIGTLAVRPVDSGHTDWTIQTLLEKITVTVSLPQVVMWPTGTREVPDSNLGLEVGCAQRVFLFPQSSQATGWNRQRILPCQSVSLHYTVPNFCSTHNPLSYTQTDQPVFTVNSYLKTV
jgi:hypothetical protein